MICSLRSTSKPSAELSATIGLIEVAVLDEESVVDNLCNCAKG